MRLPPNPMAYLLAVLALSNTFWTSYAFTIPFSPSASTITTNHRYHGYYTESHHNAKSGDFFDEMLDDDDDFLQDNENNEEDEEDINVTPFDDWIPQLNTVTLVGRVGQDPDPRYFDDGKVVLSLSLACKRKYHPCEWQVRELKEAETDWFRLELWGRDAEYATNYVTKGCRIGITGSLVIDSWTDQLTDEERETPKVIVRHLDILETRAESELRHQRSNSYDNSGGSGGRKDYDNSSAGSGGFFD